MKLSQLLEGIEYKQISGSLDVEIDDLVYDSRCANEKNVFIALKGSQVDSHKFIGSVIEAKSPAMIVEDIPSIIYELNYQGTIIQVKDTRKILSYLSANLFEHPERKVTLIGITGTKGKTTVTNMVATILRKAKILTGAIGTLGADYGNRIEATANTTPESYEIYKILSQMVKEGITHIIMEVSSQAIKMKRIEGLIFDYMVFTNLSPDHIGPNEHADFKEYKECKHQIFLQSRHGIYNLDDPHSIDIIRGFRGESLSSYSLEQKGTYFVEEYRLKRAEGFLGIEFDVKGGIDHSFSLNMPGKFSVYNGLAAMSLCLSLGVEPDIIEKGMKSFYVNGRAQVIEGPKDFVCLVDYAHNKVSLLNILETLREFEYNRLVCLFGCGGNRPPMRRYEMGEAAGRYCDHIIVTMDNPRFEAIEDINRDIIKGIEEHDTSYEVINDRREAIYYALSKGEAGDIIVIAGKGHEDYIDKEGVKTYFSDQQTVRDFFALNKA